MSLLDDKDEFEPTRITAEQVRAEIEEWKAEKNCLYKASIIIALENLERQILRTTLERAQNAGL